MQCDMTDMGDQMRRGIARLCVAAVITAVGLIAGAGAALATTFDSSWANYGPISGIPYANQASVTDNYVMGAYVSVKSTNGATIPAGWSEGQATLYRNGSACTSASMYVYPSATSGWSGGTANGYCGSGNYTSRGSTGAYNGSGYSTYFTNTSPTLAH